MHMNRERALRVVLVLVGLLFVAGTYPLATSLWHPSPSDDKGDMMMLSLYVTLGILLLIAVRNPSEHRSLIAFAAWSSFAHGTVMTIMGFQNATDREGFWIGSAVLAAIGVALIALAPRKQPVLRLSTLAPQAGLRST
jgi:hypothetical protein